MSNIVLEHHDISEGLSPSLKEIEGKVDYISLFNILHCEEPESLLKSAYNLLDKNGKIGVISLEKRPNPSWTCVKY